jgi:ankyrin repeat protein
MTDRTQALAPELVHSWLAAAERGDLGALRKMLEAEPRLLDASGRGPYWTGNARAMHYAAYRGHMKVLRWLLGRGASALPLRGEFDWAPIHFACMPYRKPVYELLLSHGAVPDIFTAAVRGDVTQLRVFLKRNPRLVSSRGPDGATPLHFAGSPAVARALLSAGANPRTLDRYHKSTPVEWTLERPRVAKVIADAAGGMTIFTAAALGDLSTVRALVRQTPRLVSARVGKDKAFAGAGDTALGIAARYGHMSLVEFLLRAGASASTTPSPLPGAVHGGSPRIVRRLLDAGADPNAFGPQGHAALHIAGVYGKVPMIRLLVSRGARLDLRDREHGGTPLGWADYHKHEKAAAFLRERGATT